MYFFNQFFKRAALFFITGFISLTGYSQIDVKWETEMSSDILWQEVTSLGNLIVCSGDKLAGINTDNGVIIWEKSELGGLNRLSYREIPSSPFFTVDLGSSILAIDQLSGDLIFDSQKADIQNVEDYFLLYNSDAILVSGSDAGENPVMVSVRMSDGSVLWKLEEKFGKIISATELGNRELLIVTLFYNYKLQADRGEILWKEANSAEAAQVEKLGVFGDLMKAAAESMAENMEIDLRYYRPEGSDVFYLGSQQESQSGFSSSNGQTMVSYKNVFNAYHISDGQLVWNQPLEVNGSLSQVAFLENGILVLPDDGNRTKINLFDYKTRDGQWGKKGKGIAIKGGIYDYLDMGESMLLVSRTSNNNYLNYLDTRTGTITFDKPVKVEGHVVGILPLSDGILYVTTASMNILDPVSGNLKWGKSIQTTPQLTAEYEGKIYAFDTKSETLKVVDLHAGTYAELSDFRLKFLGGEHPRNLEIDEDGIFLHSDQNLARFSFDGRVLYQEYYPAPKEPGWKRALLYAEAVRGAYIGAASYYISGVMSAVEDDVREQDELAGEVVKDLGNAYGDLGDQASSYAINAFRMANARHKVTLNGRDFMFVMSKQPEGIELLKVSKSTGKVEGRIGLGKDREPVYAVDDITGQVFYRSGEKIMTSYQVN